MKTKIVICLLLLLPELGKAQFLRQCFPVVGKVIDISEKNDSLWQHIHRTDDTPPEERDSIQWYYYADEDAYFYDDPWFVGLLGGCSWYCGGIVDTIIATSSRKAPDSIGWDVHALHDFDLRTAWMEGKKGKGRGAKVTFWFPANTATVTTIVLYNGDMRTLGSWRKNGRVKKLKVYADNRPVAMLHVRDIVASQRFEIGEFSTQDKPLSLTFEIRKVYKKRMNDDTAITEINFDGTDSHGYLEE
jgi:hypothetical protein